MPRRGGGGPAGKRPIPHVRNVLVVSSGKGGVGKSTVAANLAVALAQSQASIPDPGSGSGSGSAAAAAGRSKRRRVGLLDLDIFGPSIPKLMGLQRAGEPELTEQGAMRPLRAHGVDCMSMGFLIPSTSAAAASPHAEPDGADELELEAGNEDTPVVWRGMMVMKAVQQLLFDVDWREAAASSSSRGDPADAALDVLVIDMPPGTGDVALSLAQLVQVDLGALVVCTPQQVALLDARKGIALFRKTGVAIAGLVLNMSHFVSPESGKHYPLFGPPTAFDALARRQGVPVLGRVPLEPGVSAGGDAGQPVALAIRAGGGGETGKVFEQMAAEVWARVDEIERVRAGLP